MMNYRCCFLVAHTLLLIKRQTFKHTFIYRTTFKLHGDNIKDNYIISQWVSSITTLNWINAGCHHQKKSFHPLPYHVFLHACLCRQ